MAKARNDVGLVARSDVLKAATTQADARLSVIQAEALLSTSRASLATDMGLPSDSNLQIVPANREFTPPQLPDWASNWARAQTDLPEIKAAFQSTESFRYAYLGAKAAYLPTVTANGTAGLFDTGNWPNRQEWSASVTLRVPVFTGFAQKVPSPAGPGGVGEFQVGPPVHRPRGREGGLCRPHRAGRSHPGRPRGGGLRGQCAGELGCG